MEVLNAPPVTTRRLKRDAIFSTPSKIAPPMNCLDVVGVVVSPSPSHPFGLDVVGHNLVVIRDDLVADSC